MLIVVFGLSISSTWGNGHATLWRGLVRGLIRRGARVVFFEQDVPYYAEHRDLAALPGCELALYGEWADAAPLARRRLAEADVAIVTSYCPHGVEASELALSSRAPRRVFYDLDAPVTLARLRAGDRPRYLPPQGLGDFDLVLSYTGGRTLDELRALLGARRAAPLYGHVDPELHRPAVPQDRYRCDLSYLGTFAADRQAALEELFVRPARARPGRRFLIAGAQYPQDFPWSANTWFVRHLPPDEHPAFFSSSRLTLNVTREAMARMGWCPSGRLFEAAACGCPVLSDWWEGLDSFFEPGREILVARSAEDSLAALSLGDGELARIAEAARARTLEAHASHRRADELLRLLEALRPAEG